MALFGNRLSKLAQLIATGGTVPETAISTSETDTDLRLAPDGAGGVEWGTGGTGGGITRSTLGYISVGASAETMAVRQNFLKKISVTSGTMLASIVAWVETTAASSSPEFLASVYTDAAGVPDQIIATVSGARTFIGPLAGGSHPGYGRWITLPVNLWCASSTDVWIGITAIQAGCTLRYDGSGSDVHYTGTGNAIYDGGLFAITTTTRKYSLYANILS